MIAKFLGGSTGVLAGRQQLSDLPWRRCLSRNADHSTFRVLSRRAGTSLPGLKSAGHNLCRRQTAEKSQFDVAFRRSTDESATALAFADLSISKHPYGPALCPRVVRWFVLCHAQCRVARGCRGPPCWPTPRFHHPLLWQCVPGLCPLRIWRSGPSVDTAHSNWRARTIGASHSLLTLRPNIVRG